MTRKSVPFRATPQPEPAVPAAEEWVKRRAGGKKKRLTFAIPAELHSRMKVACARRGTSMVAELEALLERQYPPEPGVQLPGQETPKAGRRQGRKAGMRETASADSVPPGGVRGVRD